MRTPVCHCSRCRSQNTIRVHEEPRHEHWYCYDCGRGFEVRIGHDAAAVRDQRPRVPTYDRFA